MGTLLLLTISALSAAVSGYARFGASGRHTGMWIDLVFLTSTGLAVALTLGLLIDRMGRSVREESGSSSHAGND